MDDTWVLFTTIITKRYNSIITKWEINYSKLEVNNFDSTFKNDYRYIYNIFFFTG